MPSRIVREGIVYSPRVNNLSMGAELLYRRLMSVADDYGRYHGALLTLRVACYPTNPERFREKEVGKWFNELLRGDNPLVKTYAFGGITYLEIQDFGQQRRGKSKFPAPPWFKNEEHTEETAKQEINRADGTCLASVEADVQGSRSRSRSRSRISKSESFISAPADAGIALIPSKKPKSGKRTTDEIKKALGPKRLPWWEAFWKVYPCHEGINPAMDVYERKVHERDFAVEIYNGAKRYADQIAQRRLADPTTPAKYGQGWLNDERWKDEIQPREAGPQGKLSALDLLKQRAMDVKEEATQ